MYKKASHLNNGVYVQFKIQSKVSEILLVQNSTMIFMKIAVCWFFQKSGHNCSVST